MLVVDDEIFPGDYHFYRQNPDGTWSHKQGCGGKATNLDGNGNVINDPETCSRYDIEIDFNYGTFVGFYAVSPLTTPYQ